MERSSKAACYVAISIIVITLVAYLLWEHIVGSDWGPIHDSSGWKKWRRGNVTHIDRNGDGVVDWEIDDRGRADDYIEKEDTDFDGFFDKRFHRGFSGVPDNVVDIHEEAPRH
jgi:hypothetical protein